MKLENTIPSEIINFISPILAQAKNGITITNPNKKDNPIIYINASFSKTYGYAYEEVIGKNCRFLQKNDTQQDAIIDIRKAINNKKTITRVLRNYTKFDALVYTEVTITPIFDEDGNLKYFLGVQKDVSKEYQLLEQMKVSQSLAQIGNWELNLLKDELYWSDEIYKLFELDKTKFDPSYETFLNAIHPEDRELVNKAYSDSLETKEKYSIQHRLQMPDGRIRYVEERCESYFDDNGKPIKSIGTVQDITNLKEIELELKKTLSFLNSYKQVIDESNMVSKSDLKGNITYVNDNFCKISKYTRDELIGKPHNIIRHPDNSQDIFKDLWKTIRSKRIWKKILKNKNKYGDAYWVDTTIMPILNESNEIEEYIAVRHDITKTIEQQNRLDNILNTDQLTGLGSRYKLLKEIETSIAPGLAIINIDNFSQINDFFGYKIGDYVLKEFGIKLFELKNCEKCSTYHIQRDEFVIFNKLVKKEEFINEIIELEKKLNEILIFVNDEPLDLTFTISISFEEKENLLKTVDMAMKIAKRHNKNFIVYTDSISLNDEYENNIKWTKIVKNAIQTNNIIPVFQPIVNNKTMEYEKYESLVRIKEEDRLISPFFFLDISKKTRNYNEITKIMIEKTFEYFKNNKKEFSINLTIDDILNNEIKKFIYTILESYKIGNRVVFEIVESESIENFEKVIGFIRKVKSFNCKIAIDDFGTGYSNFQYLVKLNADYIKIDGSLIKDITTNTTSQVVVKNLVNFANDLNMKTIAEYVENEQILNIVKELGIDYSQGFYFSEPKLKI